MARGNGGTVDERVREALDICLARLRRGDDLDGCLADYPRLADVLRPLLEAAAALLVARVEPPPPPHGLARGRDRFLTAAAAARGADPSADPSAAATDARRPLDEALDAGLVRLGRGESLGDILADYPALTADLEPLLRTAGQMFAVRVTPPPPPQGLAHARERFLAAAEAARAHAGARARVRARRRVPEPAGLLARLGAWLAPVHRPALPRLVGAMIAVVLFVAFSAPVVAPLVEAAVPGDPLYLPKRWGEQLQLAFTFDPAARAVLEADHSQRRAAELEAAWQAGRVVETTWKVQFLQLLNDPSADPPLRRMAVLTLEQAGEEPRRSELAWDDDTIWLLGDEFADMAAVPPRSVIVVRVRTQPGDSEGTPLLVEVRLLEAAHPAATGTPAEPPATIVPREATETPTVATPPTASSTVVPPSPSPTPLPSPTLLPTPLATAATPVAEAKPDKTEDPNEGTLTGAVQAIIDRQTWLVADSNHAARLVWVDIGQLREKEDGGSKLEVALDAVKAADRVVLDGRWSVPDRSRFEARDLWLYTPGDDPCSRGTSTGEVRSYTPGSVLELTTGEKFLLSGVADNAIDDRRGPPIGGAQVTVHWRDCGDGTRQVTSIVVTKAASGPARNTALPPSTPQPEGPYQGIVTAVDPDRGQFTMRADNGDEFEVLYQPGVTPISGEATEIAVGQAVDVFGWRNGNVIDAASIEVVELPPPTPETPPTPVTAAGIQVHSAKLPAMPVGAG